MNSTAANTRLTLIKGNSLTCRDFEYLHPEYQDGELSESMMREMKHHHCHCEECHSYAEDIEYLIQQSKILLKERPLPADTKQRLYQRLNQEFNLQFV